MIENRLEKTLEKKCASKVKKKGDAMKYIGCGMNCALLPRVGRGRNSERDRQSIVTDTSAVEAFR
jgi:hypothetical protein